MQNEQEKQSDSGAGGLDPSSLEQVLRKSLLELPTPQLPPALTDLIAKNRGKDPDVSLVAEMVSACLGKFWALAATQKHRASVCEGVAQRLIEDPQALARLRRLLGAGPEASS